MSQSQPPLNDAGIVCLFWLDSGYRCPLLVCSCERAVEAVEAFREDAVGLVLDIFDKLLNRSDAAGEEQSDKG